MATTTRAPQRKVKTISLPHSGKLERQVLEDGKWVVCEEARGYRDGFERDAIFLHDDAWCKATKNSRVVDHYQEQGKPRYKIVAEWKMTGKPEAPSDVYPEVVQVEVEDSEALRQFLADATGLKWRVGFDPYHYQGADYTAPALQ